MSDAAVGSGAAFVAALLTNAALFFVFAGIFLFFRKRVQIVYEPRALASDAAVKPTSPGALAWIRDVLSYSDEHVYQQSGADAVMYLRFLRMAVVAVLGQVVYGCVVLMPLHATGENRAGVSGLEVITVAAVASGSPRLAAHAISIALNTALLLFLLRREFAAYVDYRLRSVAECAPQNYTLMVADPPRAPGDPRAALRDALASALERVGEGAGGAPSVAGVEAARQGPRGEPDAAVLRARARAMEADMANLRALAASGLARGEPPKGVAPAPVLFARLSGLHPAAALARRGLLAALLPGCSVYRAPDPRALVWGHLSVGRAGRSLRAFLVALCVFWLVAFWTVPTTFVQGLANLERLFDLFGQKERAASVPKPVAAWVQGFLPPLFVAILNALVPIAVRFLADLCALPSLALADSFVLSRMVAFKLVNVLLGGTAVGSLLAALPELASGPLLSSGPLRALAQGVARQSAFFAAFCMAAALSGLPLELSRAVPLALRALKLRLLCSTDRQRAAADADASGPFPFPLAYAAHVLVFAIALVYSPWAPFVGLWALLYFGLAALAHGYLVLFVHEPGYLAAGLGWRRAAGALAWAQLLHHALAAFQLAALGAPAPAAVAAACLLAGALGFWLLARAAERRFEGRCVEACAEGDTLHGARAGAVVGAAGAWYTQAETAAPDAKRRAYGPAGSAETAHVVDSLSLGSPPLASSLVVP
eukprot:tig00000498_g1604.t1